MSCWSVMRNKAGSIMLNTVESHIMNYFNNNLFICDNNKLHVLLFFIHSIIQYIIQSYKMLMKVIKCVTQDKQCVEDQNTHFILQV